MRSSGVVSMARANVAIEMISGVFSVFNPQCDILHYEKAYSPSLPLSDLAFIFRSTFRATLEPGGYALYLASSCHSNRELLRAMEDRQLVFASWELLFEYYASRQQHHLDVVAPGSEVEIGVNDEPMYPYVNMYEQLDLCPARGSWVRKKRTLLCQKL